MAIRDPAFPVAVIRLQVGTDAGYPGADKEIFEETVLNIHFVIGQGAFKCVVYLDKKRFRQIM